MKKLMLIALIGLLVVSCKKHKKEVYIIIAKGGAGYSLHVTNSAGEQSAYYGGSSGDLGSAPSMKMRVEGLRIDHMSIELRTNGQFGFFNVTRESDGMSVAAASGVDPEVSFATPK